MTQSITFKRLLGKSSLDQRTLSLSIAAGFLVCLVGRLYTLTFPLFSLDDYQIFYNGSSFGWDREIAGGRSGIFALHYLRASLGIDYLLSAPVSILLSMVMLAVTGTLLGAILFDGHRKPTILFSLIYAAHPYLTEYFYFTAASFQILLSLFLFSIGVFIIHPRKEFGLLRLSLGCLTIVASMFIYTASVAYVGAMVLLMPLVSLAVERHTGDMVRLAVRLSGFYAASLALYVALNELLLAAVGATLARKPDLEGLASVEAFLERTERTLSATYGAEPGIITPVAQMLLITCIILCALLVLARPAKIGARPWTILGAAVGIVAALIWSPAIIPFFQPIGWSALRLLSPVAVPVAAVLAAGLSVSGMYMRVVTVMLVSTLLLSFVATSNRMLYEQHLVNEWDHQTANRVLARMESDPAFPTVKRLMITGAHWARTQPLTTTFGDMNGSALAVEWAKIGVFALATGYRFEIPTVEELQEGKEYCSRVPEWPADRSVIIRNGLAIACL